MVSEQLRQARLAAGLTLQELADRLENAVTRQALSKYERGTSQPSPTRIIELATALGVPPSIFLRESPADIRWLAFRKRAAVKGARLDHLTARASQRVEAEIHLRDMFSVRRRHDFPAHIEILSDADCDYAAAALRIRWDLGYRPITGLIEMLEVRGGAIVVEHKESGFDGLSGWADQTPVLVLNTSMPPDRIRFSAAHEIGHLVMVRTGDDKQDENFANRFAASFLVPADAARNELGTHRHSLDLNELGLLKQRWGLSMQSWARRARDTEVIGEKWYRTFNILFRQRGWNREEPHGYYANESPTLFSRLVSRAFSEGMIALEEAQRLSPEFVYEVGLALGSGRSLRDIARLPRDKRNALVQDAVIGIDTDETDHWDSIPDGDLD